MVRKLFIKIHGVNIFAREVDKMDRVEISIDIKDTPRKYVDNMILGLVHSGYDVYLGNDNTSLCFTGLKDELVTEIKKEG